MKNENKENVEETVKESLKEEKKREKAMTKVAKRNDSKIIIGIIVAVMVMALGIFGFYFYKASFEVIATYDGGKVTKAEYDVYYKTFASILSQYYGYPESIIPEEIAKKAAVDKVIVKLAKEANTKLSEENQNSIDEIFNNDEYVQNFVSQGMDIGKTRELYYNDYLITQYLKDLKDNASNEDVINYIKENNQGELDLAEYKTSHILIKTIDSSNNALSDEEKANAKKKAEEILAKALAGEDFATLAKDNSEDTGTASNGGEYICYDDGTTVSEYIEAVKKLNVGEIAASLVETSYGYHIIKLNEKVENGRANNDSDREAYANKFTDGLEEQYHVNVNQDVLNQYIKATTGSDIPSDEEESTNSGTEENPTEQEQNDNE